MLDTLMEYLKFPFVRYAIVVGVLIALCSSLIGVTLVLKRYSFIGDGLSHVAFGAMAVATIFHVSNNTFLVLPVTMLTAVFLLKSGQNARVKGDAAIAMMSVGALAVGYMVLNVFSTSANITGDVCSTLFGSTSILTLTSGEVWLCAILSLAVVLLFVLFYNRIFAVTFDEDFVDATGRKSEKDNFIIALITSVVIVLGMNLVGSLLISALVVFPALSAMRVLGNFKGVVILSASISVVAALIGMILSIAFSTPIGSTIVVINILAYVICCLLGKRTKA